MKKAISLFVAIVLILITLSGCSTQNTPVNIDDTYCKAPSYIEIWESLQPIFAKYGYYFNNVTRDVTSKEIFFSGTNSAVAIVGAALKIIMPHSDSTLLPDSVTIIRDINPNGQPSYSFDAYLSTKDDNYNEVTFEILDKIISLLPFECQINSAEIKAGINSNNEFQTIKGLCNYDCKKVYAGSKLGNGLHFDIRYNNYDNNISSAASLPSELRFSDIANYIGTDYYSSIFANLEKLDGIVKVESHDAYSSYEFSNDFSLCKFGGLNALPERIEVEWERGIITCVEIFYAEPCAELGDWQTSIDSLKSSSITKVNSYVNADYMIYEYEYYGKTPSVHMEIDAKLMNNNKEYIPDFIGFYNH